MKKTTFEDTGASYDDKIAMIVAVGDATIEEASRALAECDGDVDRAMTLVYNQAQAPPSNGITAASTSRKHAPYKHSRTARHMEDDDDESATKPLEQPLRRHPPPSLSTQRSAAARDSECKGSHPFSAQAENSIMPRDPVSHAPGAFPIHGSNDAWDGRQQEAYSIYSRQDDLVVENTINTPTTEPVEAQLIHSTEVGDYRQLREQLERQQKQLEEMQRRQENVVIGQVLVAENNRDEEEAHNVGSNNEEVPSPPSNASCSCDGPKRKVMIAVVLVLVVVAVVVGSVVAIFLLRSQDDSKDKAPTVGDTVPPTLPTALSELQDLTELLSSVSPDGGAALQTPSTPQYNALNWLVGNSNLDRYSDERKIQRYALATLYYSTNGDYWLVNTGWMSDSNECEWHIDDSDFSHSTETFCIDGAVVKIILLENNLVGNIPAEVSLLSKSLQDIDLYLNELTGTIPSEVGLLSGLLYMGFDYNYYLTGKIPTEIGLMTRLTAAWLHSNLLKGTIPSEIGRLTNMVFLSLDDNMLSGTIPSELGLLTNLGNLYLFDNNLTGEYTCPEYITFCDISCDDEDNEACRSL
jgi:hypothetical protein